MPTVQVLNSFRQLRPGAAVLLGQVVGRYKLKQLLLIVFAHEAPLFA